MKTTLLTALALFVSLLASGCSSIETNPEKITSTVHEWEPPMVSTLIKLQEYRPDLQLQTQPFIALFSQPEETSFLVRDLSGLQSLLPLYVTSVEQDETLSATEKELAVAIPNLWIKTLNKYLEN